MLESPEEILFIGLGTSTVCWYRCALPAMFIGADWIGVASPPPQMQLVTGLVRGETTLPVWSDYKVVIVQQAQGNPWLRTIRHLQERGITVLYEIDDYLHGVSKQQGHSWQHSFGPKHMRSMEMCMRVCDGLIVSTEYLGRRYAKFNPNVYLARNGLDVARYQLTRPHRERCNVGWAGASGHVPALLKWLNEMLPWIRARTDVGMVTIGEDGIAKAAQTFIGDRAIGIPFTALESYPAAMTLFDIALAPAGDTAWYRAKSDLRWLEASALGIPTIATPWVYPEIEDGVTGFHASTARQAADVAEQLVDNPELRQQAGERARDHVRKHRAIDVVAPQWFEIAAAAVGGYESMYQLHARRSR